MTAPAIERGPACLPVSRFAASALMCLYQHRLMTTGQLSRLLLPGARSTYAHRQLRHLRERGLAVSVRQPGRGQLLWLATPAGAEVVEHSGQLPRRPYRMTPAVAAGPLNDHILAVSETGVAFAEAARRRGDECGPYDWTPEVAHRISDRGRSGASHVITDAVLHYTAVDPVTGRPEPICLFLEIDRASMTIARLAEKITRYARYHDYVSLSDARARNRGPLVPDWRHRYPRFPRILIVFTDAATAGQRRAGLDTCLAAAPILRHRRDDLTIAAITLTDLHDDDHMTMLLSAGGPLAGT